MTENQPGITVNLLAVFRIIRDLLTEQRETTQDDYVLAGPGEGSRE